MSPFKSLLKRGAKLPFSKPRTGLRSMKDPKMDPESLDDNNCQFLSGVVEGFYGRPWTFEQRKELFFRLKTLGMNTYLYAPKDDLKHRALWRDPYNVEECENLKQLIKCAKDHEITFYYALSPGLDMIFSDPREIMLLKKKMEQVQKLGCRAFALLFDDIDPALKDPDEKVFDSFGEAQVKVTNEIYHVLNKPKFLFCPTEYCATRAIPNVENSSYLLTLGQGLDEHIDILWTDSLVPENSKIEMIMGISATQVTKLSVLADVRPIHPGYFEHVDRGGPKVISKVISPHSIQTLSTVLKRKPVIWDNIHANDYDQRRMFLGPYHGRPTQLYNSVNGVLTNPNCEFESNFVAIHTLGAWVRCSRGDVPCPVPAEEPMNLDVDAEKQSAASDVMEDDIDVTEKDENDKIEKMDSKENGAGGDFPMETDSVSSVGPTTKITNTVTGFYDPEIALKDAISDWLLEFNKEKSAASKVYAKSGPYSLAPTPTIVQSQANSMSNTTTPPSNTSTFRSPSSTKTAKQNSRKDRGITPPPVSGNSLSDKRMEENLMEVMESKKTSNNSLTIDDLLLLVDLFYLPYSHGTKAKQILSEFKWLKNNAIKEDSEDFKELTEEEQTAKITEWKDRAEKFHTLCQSVSDMFVRFSETPNRALLYDIYPYIWDVKESVLLLDTFVVWLSSKSKLKKQRPNFFPDDPEPWVFRGGLCGELQRLLPVDSNHDMFNMRAPDVPTTCVYTIRPFQPEDEKDMYEICLSTCDDGQDGHDLFVNEPAMVGDRHVGPYISICPEHIFVVEDSYGLCGYAVSTSDSKRFYDLYKKDWLPKVQKKYSNPEGDSENWTYAEHIANSFHSPNIFLTDELYSKHSAHVKIDILPRAQEHFPMKRLMTCVLSALKAEGCNGVYSEVSLMNRDLLEAYCRLGFYEIQLKDELPEDTIYYGRTF